MKKSRLISLYAIFTNHIPFQVKHNSCYKQDEQEVVDKWNMQIPSIPLPLSPKVLQPIG